MPAVSVEFFGMFVVAALAITVVVGRLWSLFRDGQRRQSENFEPKHLPPLHYTYSTREDLEKLSSQISNHVYHNDRDHARLFKLLTSTREEVAALKKENELAGQTLRVLSSKLDRLIERFAKIS